MRVRTTRTVLISSEQVYIVKTARTTTTRVASDIVLSNIDTVTTLNYIILYGVHNKDIIVEPAVCIVLCRRVQQITMLNMREYHASAFFCAWNIKK